MTATSMLAEVAGVKAAYAALNRNDIQGFLDILDSRIERVEPSDVPGAGTYRGLEAVAAHFTKARDAWAEGRCEPGKIVVVGNAIVVSVHVHVRLKHEAAWRDGHITDVFAFRRGKATHFITFLEEKQALEWVATQLPGES